MLNLDMLIRKGYFPKELPPLFSTELLADSLGSLPDPRDNQNASKCCIYSYPQGNNHNRRGLGVPNPRFQIKLCEVILEGWTEIEREINASHLSISKPIIGGKRRAASTDKVELWSEKAKASIGSRHLLKLDISRYYPTIYTHSIPWVLHTKAIAKQQRRASLLGNRIDTAVRNTQDGQTIGIPVGPDTSFLIGELIGSAMDRQLMHELGSVKGFRFIDDYYLYFGTRSECEQAIGRFRLIAKEYELELNPQKTEIIDIPEEMESAWTSELRNFNLDNLTQHKVAGFFNVAYRYSKLFPNEPVMNYAISEISTAKQDPITWPLYQGLLLKAVIIDPTVFPRVFDQVIRAAQQGLPIDRQQLGDAMNEMIVYHGQFGDTHEIVWALWTCKQMGLIITGKAAQVLEKIKDPFVALLTLDCRNSNLVAASIDTSTWVPYLSREELYGEHWLLAYEASIKGWIQSTEDFISQDEFFTDLRRKGISFCPANPVSQPDIDVPSTSRY